MRPTKWCLSVKPLTIRVLDSANQHTSLMDGLRTLLYTHASRDQPTYSYSRRLRLTPDPSSGEAVLDIIEGGHSGSAVVTASIEFKVAENMDFGMVMLDEQGLLYDPRDFTNGSTRYRALIPIRFKYSAGGTESRKILSNILKDPKGLNLISNRSGTLTFTRSKEKVAMDEWHSLIRPINILPDESGALSMRTSVYDIL